jgi:cytoskeletal protein CcmA (bactofilin family)
MGLNGTDQAATPAGISAGIVVNGNVTSEGDLQISGRVEGEVRGATVFIEKGGSVDGMVEAERLRVSGTASGRIIVNDLAVEAGGSVAGETSYERMKVASGGLIQGSFVHRPQAQGPRDEQSLKLVSAPVNPRHVFVD